MHVEYVCIFRIVYYTDLDCNKLTSDLFLLIPLQKYEYIRIDGRTQPELRQKYCDRFQHDEQCLVAVLSITTASAGIIPSRSLH